MAYLIVVFERTSEKKVEKNQGDANTALESASQSERCWINGYLMIHHHISLWF